MTYLLKYQKFKYKYLIYILKLKLFIKKKNLFINLTFDFLYFDVYVSAAKEKIVNLTFLRFKNKLL